MKIAYLILCHTDPIHISRLANKLTEIDSGFVYIHVDNKVSIKEYKDLLKSNSKVKFITNRVNVHWGGYSSVKATLNLLDEAYKEYKYDRFVLLQGLDYPLKSNNEIIEFLLKIGVQNLFEDVR